MKKRETELDILRFGALFFVVMMHSKGNQHVESALISNHFSAFVASIAWCVPAFIMISGRFFLDNNKKITIRMLLNKYLLRIAIAFGVWSGVYVVYYVCSGAYDKLNLNGILFQYLEGPYHFWYLYMLAGLYLITPFLRKIVSDNHVCAYFLVLFSIFNVLTEYIFYLPRIGNVISYAVNRLGVDMIIGYTGYFVLGYYIHKNQDSITPRQEAIIYSSGILMLFATCILEDSLSVDLQDSDFIKHYLKPNVVIFSVAVFVCFVKRVSKINFSQKTRSVFARLSEYGFGAYLLHALIIEFISHIPLPTPIKHPYAVLVLLTAIALSISLLLTALIRKIPVIGKKIT